MKTDRVRPVALAAILVPRGKPRRRGPGRSGSCGRRHPCGLPPGSLRRAQSPRPRPSAASSSAWTAMRSIAALKKDPIFAYRGPEDLSLLPSPNQSLIEVAGLSFVRRGYFQFYEGKLWTMILELDPDKVDHYSVYTSLVAKYGRARLHRPEGVALGRRDDADGPGATLEPPLHGYDRLWQAPRAAGRQGIGSGTRPAGLLGRIVDPRYDIYPSIWFLEGKIRLRFGVRIAYCPQ